MTDAQFRQASERYVTLHPPYPDAARWERLRVELDCEGFAARWWRIWAGVELVITDGPITTYPAFSYAAGRPIPSRPGQTYDTIGGIYTGRLVLINAATARPGTVLHELGHNIDGKVGLHMTGGRSSYAYTPEFRAVADSVPWWGSVKHYPYEEKFAEALSAWQQMIAGDPIGMVPVVAKSSGFRPMLDHLYSITDAAGWAAPRRAD